MNKKIFQNIEFIWGASNKRSLPKKIHLPQIAFIGKSNVGKSSLINAICSRKSIARVSKTPGRTRQINFFSVADVFILVDLPGYGFASVDPNIKREWDKLIPYYLESTDQGLST
ncbi:MAG TPA: ribosome biogenesis GTP-binding protein YihA/YsxC, partial [Candidatus Megaira endosymbiont of Hartmannula sinica]|nr:ribosome biogenesis GTP-binding protein YihA/YsxC [Candidatus Megaera endosymbiont of Hartmannula sinica]